MKKFLFIVLICVLAFLLTFFVLNRKQAATPTQEYQQPKQAISQKSISYKDTSYSFSLYKVEDISKLKLIPNYQDKKTAKDIKNEHNCNALFSGGFYMDNNQPIGLVISDGKLIRGYTSNVLMNAVLSVNDFLTPRITRQRPDDQLDLALQTGPLLFENGSVLSLNLSNDKPARRVVAITTGANELYFLVVYNKDQVFDGPSLNDLPMVVSMISNKDDVGMADAVNLDGGSASTFIDSQINLQELTMVGSFFCVQN